MAKTTDKYNDKEAWQAMLKKAQPAGGGGRGGRGGGGGGGMGGRVDVAAAARGPAAQQRGS